MFKHLQALQMIADENGGNRASGFQGYGASVQYVLTKLRDAGYNPTTQVFDFVTFEETADPTLIAGGKTYAPNTEFITMSYSASGDTGTVPIRAVDLQLANPAASNSGCEAADFTGFTAGSIALMQRGTCAFADKVTNAQAAGAVGAIIFNQGTAGRTDVSPARWARPPRTASPRLPTSRSRPSASRSPRASGSPAWPARPVRSSSPRRATAASRPTSWPTRAGATRTTSTIVGSHLDSVTEGPGINDNGSGSAFNLELAIAMAKKNIKPENRVRFAWWGAEESGLVGATRYVAAISEEEFDKIAANLNFDMLASPNHANFVYDGDFSDTPPPATAPTVNPGAAYIERTFVDYFDSVGVQTEPTAFDGRSDYKPFQDNGVAAGGLFSGAEVAKTAAQAAKWGGTVGQAFDPCYHQACDDIDNLDMEGAEDLGDGGAHVLATLAEDRNLRETLAGGLTGRRRPRRPRRQEDVQGAQGQARRVPREEARPLTRTRSRIA